MVFKFWADREGHGGIGAALQVPRVRVCLYLDLADLLSLDTALSTSLCSGVSASRVELHRAMPGLPAVIMGKAHMQWIDRVSSFVAADGGQEGDKEKEKRCEWVCNISRVLFLPLLLTVLGGICNSVMDTITYHYATSIFATLSNQQWWDPQLSWTNKWKNGDPEQGEAWLGSSTVFVWVTDAWHLFKSIFLSLLFAAGIALAHGYMTHFTVPPHTSGPVPGLERTHPRTRPPLRILMCYYALYFVVAKLSFGAAFELFWSVVWLD